MSVSPLDSCKIPTNRAFALTNGLADCDEVEGLLALGLLALAVAVGDETDGSDSSLPPFLR